MAAKYQDHYGVRFRRDSKTGYYLNSTMRIRAHRFVWEYHNGPIPEGMHIHHKDGDKSNNDISNLEMLTTFDHLSMHMQERVADPEYKARMDQNLHNIRHLTKEWHGSEEGLEWHRQHALNVFRNMKPRQYTCDQCGTEFERTPHGTNRFCSNGCKTKWRREAGFDNIECTCLQCKKPFTKNKYSKSLICSRGCANTMRKYCKDNGLPYPKG